MVLKKNFEFKKRKVNYVSITLLRFYFYKGFTDTGFVKKT